MKALVYSGIAILAVALLLAGPIGWIILAWIGIEALAGGETRV